MKLEVNNKHFRERLHNKKFYNSDGREDGDFCDKLEHHMQ
jgi:hypothetical protein